MVKIQFIWFLPQIVQAFTLDLQMTHVLKLVDGFENRKLQVTHNSIIFHFILSIFYFYSFFRYFGKF